MSSLRMSSLVLRRLAILVLLALIILRPGFGTTAVSTERAGLSVLLVVDRTKSMDALDVDGGPRFRRVRADLIRLVDLLPDAQFAVISFASDVELELPLTSDRAEVRRTILGLELEDPVDAEGSRLDRPLRIVRAQLTSLRRISVDRLSVLVLASDGENTAADTQDSFDVVTPLVDDGAVLGYGTAEGGRMAWLDDGDPAAGFLRDASSGRDALSVLDEDNLAQVADEIGVPYAHRDDDVGIEAVAAGIASTREAAANRVATDRELTWLFALALLTLALLEVRRGWRAMWTALHERRSG